ncbi:MAG: phosphoribosylglycinamide formyltransferase [Eubacteriaceae bacterium]|jgi:phosphoribosylglycinamide formyltransferase-1|nr:phosphoribosylglycinamide formyltransferase [Eubacteriaceae bacterium]
MKKIGVLISGGGTNLQALIDNIHGDTAEIALVVSNKADVYGLTRAEQAGIPSATVSEQAFKNEKLFFAKIVELLQDYQCDGVILAGFMRILTEEFIDSFPNRIINIHPALIPSFCGEGYYGMHVHRAVVDYGVKVTGATVHFVNAVCDGGPIILQECVSVKDDDTPEDVQQRVLALEHRLLPKAVALFCQDRLVVEGRRVQILP